METLKFENLPNAVAELQKVQSEILALLLNKAEQQQPEIETPIQLEDVVPITGLTKPTLYGYVQRNEIPYHKKGNRLYFFKTEIVDWIKTGKQKTLKELEAETDLYLSNKNKGLK
ncbi:DNA binding domain-containing protein [Formosa agariphila KMM 3901]|uniref:DNA binding domain-containing protein n=1 Tax=Formosa agariphila (strain DSM 15362 / KCTC 12365 / LMG 23005 / KMM 3901 / M-2Alg 35-1) TaxID=1347342 RepID=T2KPL6_FORAG|nr:helix-turn-helix domain-containing protein [Formosa agariphila]CDF80438.1 DNA binding domain-containing protein [Formosa agariphila KMM 3901]